MGCFLFHEWCDSKIGKRGAGCVCLKCGATRHNYNTVRYKNHVCGRMLCREPNPNREVHVFDKNARWNSDKCKCKICDSIIHDWDGCICKVCKEVRYQESSKGHDLEGCVCKKCGMTFHDSGKSCICTRCGKQDHSIDDHCYCSKCHQTVHQWKSDGKCTNCWARKDLQQYSREIEQLKKISDNVKGGIYGAQISESDCAKAKEIGEELFRIGGMELLEKVSAFMERECPHTVQIRDQLWDGVGEWHYSSEQWSDY